ncbi:MAG: cobalamin-dependent protein [Candidatus Omnitrophota bacterium]
MKIYAISMDRHVIAIGLRRIVASAKKAGYNVKSVYFLDDAWGPSQSGFWLKQKTGAEFAVNYAHNEEAILRFAEIISDAGVLAFSLMSAQRDIAKKICEKVKSINSKVKIIIGGYHPTTVPEDAISFADVICQGEGEKTFVEFLRRTEEGQAYIGLPNTWVNENGNILKNQRSPVMTPEEMESMPFMEYGLDEQYFFSYAHGVLIPISQRDLIRHVGTTYSTIWTVGCPHICSFCSNDMFIGLDKGYAKYRGPSPSYIISEIKNVMGKFPLDYIVFCDSDFIGRSLEDITEFSEKFRTEIGLKFKINGMNPVSVSEDKIKVLIEGGLVRANMGFESGSRQTLKLYKRAGGIEGLKKACEILSKFKGKMVPTCYEIITDNPFEDKEHLYETIDFLDSITGPFTISLFSLCLMPGTALSRNIKDEKLLEEHIVKEYLFSYRPTAINILISIFAVFKPPHYIVKLLKRMIKGREKIPHPLIKNIFYKLHVLRRAIDQIWYRDFSTFPYWVMVLYYRLKRFSIASRK